MIQITKIRKCITISPADEKWIKQNSINLSQFIHNKILEMRERKQFIRWREFIEWANEKDILTKSALINLTKKLEEEGKL